MPSFTPGTTHKYSFPVTNIVLNASEITQISLGNSRRIALGIFSLTSDLVIYPITSGIQLSQISPYNSSIGGIWYLASDVGPLCQLDWYGFTPSSGTVTVLEVVEES